MTRGAANRIEGNLVGEHSDNVRFFILALLCQWFEAKCITLGAYLAETSVDRQDRSESAKGAERMRRHVGGKDARTLRRMCQGLYVVF